MLAHQQRVLDEASTLNIKLEKLHVFMKTALYVSVPPDESDLLVQQSKIMQEYLDILNARINLFK